MASNWNTPFNSLGLNVLNFARELETVIDRGTVNANPAFEACLAAATAIGGAQVHIPRGTYDFTAPLIVSNNLEIIGEGNGGNGASGQGTILRWPAGSGGIIHSSVFSSRGLTGQGAEFGTYRDFAVRALGKTTPGCNGFSINSRANLHNIVIQGFSGHGIAIIGATDGNTAEGNTIWQQNADYRIGQWARQAGATMNLLTNTTGSITVTLGPGVGQATFVRTGANWNNIPPNGNDLIITAGSPFAGAGNANVGLWFVSSSPSANTIVADKYSNDPFYINRAIKTSPVAVAITAITATTNIQAFAHNPNRYFCTKAGRSAATGTGPSTFGVGIVDGITTPVDTAVVWQCGGAGQGIADGGILEQVRVYDCGKSGIYLDGDNANTWTFTHPDIVSCANWGIEDRSFFGTAILKPEIAGCTLGTITNDPAGNHYDMLVLAPYYEGGQPGHLLYNPACVVGGLDGTAGPQAGNNAFWMRGGSLDPHSTSVSAGGHYLRSITGGTVAGTNDPHAMRLVTDDDQTGLLMGTYDFAKHRWGLFKLYDDVDESPLTIYRDSNWLGTLGLRLVRIAASNGGAGTGQEPGVGIFASRGNPQTAGVRSSVRLISGDIIYNQNPTDVLAPVAWRATENCGTGPDWTPNSQVGPRRTATPTVKNGRMYNVHVSSTSNNTGPTQPTWTTGIGSLVPESTGLVWECWGPDGSTTTFGSGLQPVYGTGPDKDLSASPGTTGTSNTLTGKFSLSAGNNSFTLSNSLLVTGNERFFAMMQKNDATINRMEINVTAGSVVFSFDGNAAAALPIAWFIQPSP